MGPGAKPDQTLAELKAALPTSATLATIWRTLERLDLTVTKNGVRHRATAAGDRDGPPGLDDESDRP